VKSPPPLHPVQEVYPEQPVHPEQFPLQPPRKLKRFWKKPLNSVVLGVVDIAVISTRVYIASSLLPVCRTQPVWATKWATCVSLQGKVKAHGSAVKTT
jgi:hypothetical protein